MLLDDISDLLTTGGITTQIYKSVMPEQPNDAILITETGGRAAVHAMSSGPGNALLEQPGFQVIRRSQSYETARTEMRTVFQLLDGLSERTINSVRYSYVEAQQSPFPIGRDDALRSLIAVNFLAYKTL